MNRIFKVLPLISFCAVMSDSFASQAMDSNQFSAFVQLDKNKTIYKKQLKQLRGLDLVGINPYTNQAEVYITQEEFDKLKDKKLKIIRDTVKNTSTTASLDKYLNPTQIRDALNTVHSNFPDITELYEIGKTHNNLPILALEISEKNSENDKPVILFNGMHHAREVMSAEVVMHIAKTLTEQSATDPEIKSWLEKYKIILVPQVNPDGNERVHNGYNMWRKNAYQSAGTIAGVDLNRNYPAYWNHCNGSSGYPFSETFRGTGPGSEPETQAMLNLARKNMPVTVISYHSYSQMIIYPFACSNVKNPSKDTFVDIAKNIRSGIRDDRNQYNTYSVGTAPELLYDADGGDDDWYWHELGAISFTIEVNASTFQPNYDLWRNVTVERQEGGWKNLIRQMEKSGFHGFVKSEEPGKIQYTIKKDVNNELLSFAGENDDKKFSLKSANGLLYQMTLPGKYQIYFYKNDELIKALPIEVGSQNVDIGTVYL